MVFYFYENVVKSGIQMVKSCQRVERAAIQAKNWIVIFFDI